MLPDFNSYKKSLLVFLLLTTFGFRASAQQLVYDLKQNWVYYNFENHGFLPLGQQDLHNKVISFKLSNKEFDKFYLTLVVPQKSYLFYRANLISTLKRGTTSFSIDSLKKAINNKQPTLTIYGNKLLPELKTEVRTQPTDNNEVSLYQPSRFTSSFSDFFYLALTVIIIFFVILKTRFAELTDQYLLFQRAFKFRTIDELIYKINFLGIPNIFFIFLISLILGFVTLSFMYFYPGELAILGIYPGVGLLSILVLYWLEITAIILVIFIAKYFLMILLSAVFTLKITSIHFAAFLRLIFYLSFILLIITSFQFVIIGVLPKSFYWSVLLFGLVVIELIIFFKLTLVSTHTLIYNIIYLCATEIIPIVFLFKFFTR